MIRKALQKILSWALSGDGHVVGVSSSVGMLVLSMEDSKECLVTRLEISGKGLKVYTDGVLMVDSKSNFFRGVFHSNNYNVTSRDSCHTLFGRCDDLYRKALEESKVVKDCPNCAKKEFSCLT